MFSYSRFHNILCVNQCNNNNNNNNTSRKSREKPEDIQHITGACCALDKGNYTDGHHQVAKDVHQELAVKCGLTQGPPMPLYKYKG
jgi:hypothetical protein